MFPCIKAKLCELTKFQTPDSEMEAAIHLGHFTETVAQSESGSNAWKSVGAIPEITFPSDENVLDYICSFLRPGNLF